MHYLRLSLLIGWLAAATLAGAQTSQPADTAKSKPEARQETLFQSYRLLELPVRNRQGEILGSIENLAIDWAKARVAYAILSFGGYLGGALDVEDKLFAVPAKALQLSSDQESMRLDADQETIDQIQGFDSYDWPDLADPNRARQLHRQFRQEAYWEELAPEREDQPKAEQATAQYMQKQSTGSLQKASDLIGVQIRDNEGEVVAEIQELEIDWQNAQVRHVLASVGGFLGFGAELMAFKPAELQLTAREASAPLRFSSDNYFRLDISKEQLLDDDSRVREAP